MSLLKTISNHDKLGDKLPLHESERESSHILLDFQNENQHLKEELVKLQLAFKESLAKQLEQKNKEDEFLQTVEEQYLTLMKKHENLLADTAKLKKNYNGLKKEYNALRNSKLGRITIKYWAIRKKLRKRVDR